MKKQDDVGVWSNEWMDCEKRRLSEQVAVKTVLSSWRKFWIEKQKYVEIFIIQVSYYVQAYIH
jgi:hypothetical protein